MDTIAVKLELDYNGKESEAVSQREMEYVRISINNIKSRYGYTYCDVMEMYENIAIVKISYPRFFKGVNAYLISSSDECREVQEAFYNELNLICIVKKVKLLRVDIPFTYHMSEEEYFHNYKNIFKIFAIVYKNKNENACPKMISQILNEHPETLVYANTRVIGNYNCKIQVYNQYQNLEDKFEEEYFRKVIEEFPDLSKRIRLEVSKRTNRKTFTHEAFKNFDIYKEYYPQFKDYLLKNFLDMDLINAIYEELAQKMAEELIVARQSPTFKYEVFILNNLKELYDYQIIRRALSLVIDNKKTFEAAITTIRKILGEYENSNEVIVMDTYKHLREMYEQFKE